MEIFWWALTLLFAYLSARLAARKLIPIPPSLPLGLGVIVLFVIYNLLPVHLVAGLELTGLIDAVTLPAVATAGAALWIATYGLAIMAGVPARDGRNGFWRGKGLVSSFSTLPAYLSVVLLISALSWLVFAANTVLSYYFGWDGLTYHLPLAVLWLQEGSLAIPSGGYWKLSLPSNAEIGMWLFIAAGLDRISFAFNLLAGVVAAMSVYVLSRRVSAQTHAAMIGAALFAMLPVVQFQTVSGYVDMYGASFVLAGIAILAHRWEPGERPEASKWYVHATILAGLCWGIATGTKPVFYSYAGLCMIGAASLIWFERKEHGRSPILLVGILALCVLVPSAFWFLRATFTTGNPIYPIAFDFMSAANIQGIPPARITHSSAQFSYVRSAAEWLYYPWVEFKNYGYGFGTGSGVGAVWAVLVPLGILFSIVFTLRNLRRTEGRYCGLLLIIFAVMLLSWWFALQRVPRFGLPMLGVACILTVPLIDFLLRLTPAPLKLLLVLSFAATALLSTFVPAHELLGRIRSDEWNRAEVFEIPPIFDDLPEGTVVWNLGSRDVEPKNFALAGKHLTNRVIRWPWRGTQAAEAFIVKNRVDIIANMHPFCCDDLETIGARLIFDGLAERTKWRVWAVSTRVMVEKD